jgi:polyketide biosynthesis enoyl-CoA hydratase PksH
VDTGPVTGGTVQVRRFAGHHEVQLLDPARGNPLGPELIDPLLVALEEAAADPGCRAVLISATGEYFCRGLDLANVPDEWYADPAQMPPWRLFSRLHEVPVTTVALVNGQATGGGVALAAACDLVMVGPAAGFRLTELLLGLIPALAMPFITARVGVQPAYRMALTATLVGPWEAVRMGLADMEYPPTGDPARPLLTMLRRIAPETLRAMKELRTSLYPQPSWQAQTAGLATIDRLCNPMVRERIDTFRLAGVPL